MIHTSINHICTVKILTGVFPLYFQNIEQQQLDDVTGKFVYEHGEIKSVVSILLYKKKTTQS